MYRHALRIAAAAWSSVGILAGCGGDVGGGSQVTATVTAADEVTQGECFFIIQQDVPEKGCPCHTPDLPITVATPHFDIHIRDGSDPRPSIYCTEASILEYGYGKFLDYTQVDLNQLSDGARSRDTRFTSRYMFTLFPPAAPPQNVPQPGDPPFNACFPLDATGETCFDQSVVCQDFDQVATAGPRFQQQVAVMLHELANGWANAYIDNHGQELHPPDWYASEGQAGFLAQHALTDAGFLTEAATDYDAAYQGYLTYHGDTRQGACSTLNGCDMRPATHVIMESLWRAYGWRLIQRIDAIMQGQTVRSAPMDTDEVVAALCDAAQADLVPWLSSNLRPDDFSVGSQTQARCALLPTPTSTKLSLATSLDASHDPPDGSAVISTYCTGGSPTLTGQNLDGSIQLTVIPASAAAVVSFQRSMSPGQSISGAHAARMSTSNPTIWVDAPLGLVGHAGNASTYSDMDIQPSTEYCYHARVAEGFVVSGDSNDVCITTPPRSEPPAAFYFCGGGTDLCGAPLTGLPDQLTCGADAAYYQCTPSGWQWRPELGNCNLDCSSDSTSYTCPDLTPSNACGEPQSGTAQQLACSASDDVYQCVHGADDPANVGHWERAWSGGCLQSLGMTCAAPPTSFYFCDGGADYCGAPVTGIPDQIACGRDGARYQCQPDGWHWRGDLGPCTQACDSESSFTCPDLGWSNACGEPQSGVQQQLACNPYNDVYQCVKDANDAPGAGHWELRFIGNCLQSLGITCPPQPTTFYSCEGGTDFCGAPVTGVPDQVSCGRDGARYECQPDGWHWRGDLGPCTLACTGNGLFTCGESPGLCWEPQTGVQQELNCTPFNDVMQCVQGPGDAPDQGHWEVKWLGNCDAITGRRCSDG